METASIVTATVSKLKSLFKPVKVSRPVKQEVKILLIGSTGNGKSTLGNYLLNPKLGKQAFETATDNLPKTKRCKTSKESFHVNTYSYLEDTSNNQPDQEPEKEPGELTQEIKCIVQPVTLEFTVIDTPGLNEDKETDFYRMIDLIETIENEKSVNACVIVVKFSAKIDQQYKDTLKYYSRLLPQFFSKNNVLIVMTDFATDPRSVAIRERQGMKTKEIMENVMKEVVKNANLTYEPMLFTIDCLPYGAKEMAENETKRDDILSYLIPLSPVSLQDFHVAKTMAMLEADQKKKEHLFGEIDGYNWRLKEVNRSATEALDSTNKHQRRVTEYFAEKADIIEELEEKNSEKLIIMKTWKIDDNKFWPWWKSLNVYLETDYEIMDVEPWTNGSSKFDKIITEKGSKVCKAKLMGNFNCHLLAELKLKTPKRIYYKDDIKELQARRDDKERKLQDAKLKLEKKTTEHKKHQREIEKLETFIEERRKKIEKLSVKFISLKEIKSHIVEDA